MAGQGETQRKPEKTIPTEWDYRERNFHIPGSVPGPEDTV